MKIIINNKEYLFNKIEIEGSLNDKNKKYISEFIIKNDCIKGFVGYIGISGINISIKDIEDIKTFKSMLYENILTQNVLETGNIVKLEINEVVYKVEHLQTLKVTHDLNLNKTICDFIIPKLKNFKDNCYSIPKNLSREGWVKVIDSMIWSFEFIKNKYKNDTFESYSNWKRYKDGMNLFKEYLPDLWDNDIDIFDIKSK